MLDYGGRGVSDSGRMTGKPEVGCARQIQIRLGGMGGNGADVCNVVASFEGWDRVDVQDDAGDGSAGFECKFAKIVGDKADFHALLNIGTALHKWVPNARAVGQDIHDSVEPYGILDGARITRKHLESTHGAECPVDAKGDVIRFDGAGIAGFNDDGRFAASSKRCCRGSEWRPGL